MDSLFDLFDQRLKTQEHEVADLRDFLKKRAELERKYSKDLEALEKQMFGKHKVRINSNKERFHSFSFPGYYGGEPFWIQCV